MVLISPKREILKYAVRLQFPATNNLAEYKALLIGLSLTKVLKDKTFIVQADSQLVIGQVRGDYEVKEERMQKYLKVVKELLQYFDSVEFQQIPRGKNAEANFLAWLALSNEHGIPPESCMETRGQPNTEGGHVIKI